MKKRTILYPIFIFSLLVSSALFSMKKEAPKKKSVNNLLVYAILNDRHIKNQQTENVDVSRKNTIPAVASVESLGSYTSSSEMEVDGELTDDELLEPSDGEETDYEELGLSDDDEEDFIGKVYELMFRKAARECEKQERQRSPRPKKFQKPKVKPFSKKINNK